MSTAAGDMDTSMASSGSDLYFINNYSLRIRDLAGLRVVWLLLGPLNSGAKSAEIPHTLL